MRLMFERHNPHGFLGIHPLEEETVIRFWNPGATSAYLEVQGRVIEAQKIDATGVFEARAPKGVSVLDYRIYGKNGELTYDPYAFWPTLGEVDLFLFNQGRHYRLYEKMGGRLVTHLGCKGAQFTVWAPNAEGVSVVGDFNGWDGRVHPMRSLGISGVWELFIPDLQEGDAYKFEIRVHGGGIRLKADPYALYSELRPKTASRLFDIDRFEWQDKDWMEKRRSPDGRPMVIYEVHLGSWKRGLGYLELARELASYCREMGFTHVELMPPQEHPLDESWGYQVTGFFAATSRFGSPRQFQGFVDLLHREGIGVIIDWVPAHFPMDEFALTQFDGTYLYEHADPKQGFHPHWNTAIFNYGRPEVSNFLIASALFWLDKMHVDGIRFDAVASMLYLDYGRSEGEWIPNKYGRRENLEAIEFLKHLNGVVHHFFPAAVMCAEESTAFIGVTHEQGLGFDLKWNMGWMNDTLKYFSVDPFFRSHHHRCLTFGLIYAFSERFLLVLSHDEVVHEKGSLISKMPGDDWQKFASVRLLYSYMICQVGKKLLFMGGEIGQWSEWNCLKEVEWHLLNYERHQKLKKTVQELNHFYLEHPALWDDHSTGFEWVDFQDASHGVISYYRKNGDKRLLCLHHFTPVYEARYRLPLKGARSVCEVFNTDREEFGGSGKVGGKIEVFDEAIIIELPPLATVIFEVSFG